MIECICTYLKRKDGLPKGKEIPATPPVRAVVTCYANLDTDCPKTRAKFRISEYCFRIKKRKGAF